MSNSICFLSSQLVTLHSDIEAKIDLLYKVVLTSKFVDETLMYEHSNESFLAVLSCGTVCYAVQRWF